MGLVHTFLTQALTLFYDPAFTISQTVQLNLELDPDIHQELGMDFNLPTGLSGTFSPIIHLNGELHNTLLAASSNLAPGPDGVCASTLRIPESGNQVRPRLPAGQIEGALHHNYGESDMGREQLQGLQALAHGLSWELVVRLVVTLTISLAVRPAIEPAMGPTISPVVEPASLPAVVLALSLASNLHHCAITTNTQERRASSRLAQSRALAPAVKPVPPPPW